MDISQGVDVRLMTDDISRALGQVKHLRSVHFAWDLMGFEDQVIKGIKILSKNIKEYKQMCYVLVGYNTTYDQDMYRIRKLVELGVKPYVMVYNSKKDDQLNHFARWVNGYFYKVSKFEDYRPWVKAQAKKEQITFPFDVGCTAR